jgi:hydrogenase maturation protein HypF
VDEVRGARVFIQGVVQGVGFRPFVYALASRLMLRGWVRNTSAGVEIAVDGTGEALEAFVKALQEQAPPLARIDTLRLEPHDPDGFTSFDILQSQALPRAFQPVSPDVGTCSDCLREMFDPADRRYRYPFINCTNCGPRFTIIRDIPYDRPLTTMAAFEMCAACAAEYRDPRDRRFHAQPVACPSCGPQIWLEQGGARIGEGEQAVRLARSMLAEGRILAIKGLGGFHLACHAAQPQAVRTLRQRKLRVDKPFALMMADMAAVEAHGHLDEAEREALQSSARPIVILARRTQSPIASDVAPGQDTLAAMLPYTPLHHLLLERAEGFPDALVMTSGNLSEEPIATGNDEARRRLSPLADAFLMHDRDIHIRCDDPVVRTFESAVYPIRRSRGYTPFPVHLAWQGPTLLGCGGELKNAFCVTRERYAFLSHHVGDLENYETLCSFEAGVTHFERLFRVQPQALAYDLHPDYLATRYAIDRAERQRLPAIGVQHHHAHIAAVMAEHHRSVSEVVIGVAFDGTGYGPDGAIWGGEILLASYSDYRRAYHLRYVPMPGGAAAVRQPWRMALAWLNQAGCPWQDDLAPVAASSEEERQVLGRVLGVGQRSALPGANAPLTSSVGRLFDAVAALVGVRQTVNYEAQAALELEARLDPHEIGAYPLELFEDEIDAAPAIRAILADLRKGTSVGVIAARFHNGLAALVTEACRQLRETTGMSVVALSGGVWQNMALLTKTTALLHRASFEILVHRQVPTNDGGLALGQVSVAAAHLHRGDGGRDPANVR